MFYFKNGDLIGESNNKSIIFNDFDDTKQILTEDEKTNLENGYKLIDGIIQKPEDRQEKEDERLLLFKKLECRDKILGIYSETDQRNCALFGTQTEKEDMSIFIQAMLTEFRTNGKDADFTNINP